MAIENYFNTSFTVGKESEAKVDGRLKRLYTTSVPVKGAFFTPSTTKTVRFGKRDFIVTKTLYCPASIDIANGDIVIEGVNTYDVIGHIDTLRLGHHLRVDLVSRESSE